MRTHLRKGWRRLIGSSSATRTVIVAGEPVTLSYYLIDDVPDWKTRGEPSDQYFEITASTSRGDRLGILGWDGSGVIKDVWVLDRVRRLGLATAMLEFARELFPVPIYHSTFLTPEGREWSRAVGQVKISDATNWRAFSASPVWREYDAVIMTQFRGRERYYEVFTYGELLGHYPRLDEAKQALEMIYGDLAWEQITMPDVEVVHYYFGPTTEFTDPLTVYVTKLPKLGKMASYYKELSPYEQEWLDKVMAGVGPIYRGYQVNLPPDLEDQVYDLLEMPMEPHERDQHYGVGPLLLKWLEGSHWQGGVGLGRHWTASRSMAEGATTHGNVGGNFPILLTAEYEPSMVDLDFTLTTPGNARSEQEVTLKPGSKVTVTNVEVQRGAISYSFRSVLRQPMRARI